MTNQHSKLATLFTLIFMLAAVSSQAAELDANYAWTTAGSVGIVQGGNISLSRDNARLTAGMPDGTTIIQYNISATNGLVGPIRANQTLRLDVKFRDTGERSRVRVFVKESSMTGSSTTLLAFDSDDVQAQLVHPYTLRVGSVETAEGQTIGLDFQHNVYYLEVWLTKRGRGSAAAFGGASLKATSYEPGPDRPASRIQRSR
jgi:hypothetical protein